MNFDVHLECGDSIGGAGYLKIHITGMVFIPKNI